MLSSYDITQLILQRLEANHLKNIAKHFLIMTRIIHIKNYYKLHKLLKYNKKQGLDQVQKFYTKFFSEENIAWNLQVGKMLHLIKIYEIIYSH